MAEPTDLFDVARRVRRLAPSDQQSPHAFAALTTELAARIEAVARGLGARPRPTPGPVKTYTVTIAGRRVLVQRRRGRFGVG
jgi:hypothetical protein